MSRSRHAAAAPTWRGLLRITWQQWRTEQRLARQGVGFRRTDTAGLARAYSAMSVEQFTAINGRQAWANWRTIPRHVERIDAPTPWRVVDLGCGAGQSTEVLAWACPSGSRILGYELVPSLLDVARRQAYKLRCGCEARVEFRQQALASLWRDEVGQPLPTQSVTLVNASGVIGHHLDADHFERVAAEIGRVLAPAGVALLDVGPKLGAVHMQRIMRRHGLVPGRRERSCWLDPYGQIAFAFIGAGSSAATQRRLSTGPAVVSRAQRVASVVIAGREAD